MSTKSITRCGLSLFSFFYLIVSSTPVLASDPRDEPKEVKSTMSVISIERTAEFPPPPNATFKAKEGFEFAVVTMKILTKNMDELPSGRDVKMLDVDGKKYSCTCVTLSSSEYTFAFGVKKEMKLKTLQAGSEKFDLSIIKEKNSAK